MSSDDHSLIPLNRADLAHRSESDSPILSRMARDLLVKAKAQLANDAAEAAETLTGPARQAAIDRGKQLIRDRLGGLVD